MKKILLLAAVAVFGLTSVNAQEGFSVQAGMSSVTAKSEFEGISISATETGFYLGVGYELSLSDKIDLEPAVLYSFVEDFNALYIPIMFKYNVSEKFNIQAGPQVNYILEDLPQGEFGLDIAAGLGYDISDNFFAIARYGFQVSRDLDNVDVNTLQIGVGYKF